MICTDDVRHLAKLSRLRFDETEVKQYAHDLGVIFEYAELLNKLNTDNVEPSAHAIPIKNIFRDDVVRPFNADALLENAPDKEGHAFKVPKILVD